MMKDTHLTIKTFLNYCAVFVVFAAALSPYHVQGGVSIRGFLMAMIVVLILLVPFMKDFRMNKAFVLVFLTIIVSSLYNVLIGNDTMPLLAKQTIGIFLSSVFFYLLIKVNNYDVKYLFEIYLRIAIIVAAIGLIQFFSFLVGFEPGYNYSHILPGACVFTIKQGKLLRVCSILIEPSQFCSTMMPAFFAAIVCFTKNGLKFKALNRWKSVLIITAFFLTFSTVGYVGVFLAFLLIILNCRNIRLTAIVLVLGCLLFFFLYNNVVMFRNRARDGVLVLRGKMTVESSNQSVYAMCSNVLVTMETFKSGPLAALFGTGLGSHPVSHDRHAAGVIDLRKIYYKKINAKDANSFFLRLLSETGLFGLLAFLVFIVKCYVLKDKGDTGYFWIISTAILVLFLVKLLRNGHYFNGGFYFFFWMYYFTKMKATESKQLPQR